MPKTIALDFDGVLHRYDSGWQGPRRIPDGPVPGAVDFLLDLLADNWDVAVYSTRSHQLGGRRAMKRWLRHHATEHYWDAGPSVKLERWFDAGWIPDTAPLSVNARDASRWLVRQLRWPRSKPPAVVTLDDRVIQFDGHWPCIDELNKFKPWNRR